MEVKEIFAKRLKELLEEKEITKYKFAKEINVNKQTVSFWLDGINEPKISYLKIIADYFNVSSDYLIGRQDGY